MSYLLSMLLAVATPPPDHTVEAVTEDRGWTGTGELGMAMARGNTHSESLNTRFVFQRETAHRKHQVRASGLRTRSEVTAVYEEGGEPETRAQITANRFDMGASTSIKFDPRRYLVGAVRYENDDFSSYDYQGTASLGYGHHFIRNDTTTLLTEIGPGYRRADTRSGGVENGPLLRGLFDFSTRLTDTTTLVNTLLVEAGDDNTYAQNDFGVSVAMNASLALKAGFQARHNTEASDADISRTDRLTTVNLVYTFR